MKRSSSGENENDDLDETDVNNHNFNNASIKSKSSMTSLPRNPSGTFKPPSDHKPKSPYSAFTHQIRKIVPEDMACKLGCGGEKCKYCNSDWPEDDMAINGVFSHWITQDIVAMARPTTAAIQNFKIIDTMKKLDIKSLFNLEMMNEHKACGKPLENSGFSYDPTEFIKNNIYYYNFGFQDYSTVSMPSMVDMVKVFSFAVSQGKVAVHCHAGLGRTGLFIASYLVYSFRMSAKDAIYYVRDKRQKSVQMNDQIEAVEKFENFLKPLRVVFAIDTNERPFTLNAFLCRQRYFLHGYESRQLKHIPKILYICVERLKKLLKEKQDHRGKLSNNRAYLDDDDDDVNNSLDKMSALYVQQIVNSAQNQINQQLRLSSGRASSSSSAMALSIASALSSYSFDKHVIKVMELHEHQFNNENEAYEKLMHEKDPNVIVALMWHWLDHLQIPPLREQEIIVLANTTYQDKAGEICFNWDHLDTGTYQTINCILDIYRDLINKTDVVTEEIEEKIIFTLISVLTHAAIPRHKDLSSKTSQSSLSTMTDFEDDDRGKERLINHTNRLKKQHVRTIYHAIITLIRRSPEPNQYSRAQSDEAARYANNNVGFYQR